MVPSGAIIGSVIGICSIISLSISLLWLKRRRRQRQESAHAALSANPFLISSSDVITSIPSKAANDSDAHSFNAFRRQYLRNELRTAKELRTVNEQMVHVETGGSSGLNTGSVLPQPDVVSRLAERNEILTARIHELESQLESSWALGFSDDLPPGYTEGET
jgi:hypothetical protein